MSLFRLGISDALGQNLLYVHQHLGLKLHCVSLCVQDLDKTT